MPSAGTDRHVRPGKAEPLRQKRKESEMGMATAPAGHVAEYLAFDLADPCACARTQISGAAVD